MREGGVINQLEFDYGLTGCRLRSLDTCLVLEFDDAGKVRDDDFLMAGGDVLVVGDKFTGIDKRGSAGNPPVKLTPGWYQQYLGKITVASDAAAWTTSCDRSILLFDAFNREGDSALDGFPSRYPNRAMAYVEIEGEMFYWNSCFSGRVVKCLSIDRVRE